ncbi:hypothetical protein F5882DRAFT_326431 [Hyaloscypha sp. PMI_1271]|nr:hypothetical protein F5882DRAFT_326431 [Hyaloscypha sp. PMI_1271]
MVLDALSAVSLAATIVQFVDFSSKIVSKGYHLHRSAEGVLPENARLAYVIADLKDLNIKLQCHERLGCLTRDEQALEDLSSQCSTLATELLGRLEKLKVEQNVKNRKWKSFRQALKIVWGKEALDQMAATLSDYRSQLELHVLLSLREEFRIQNETVARFHEDNKFHITTEHEKTRAKIIEVVKESRLIFCEPCLTLPSSEKSAEDEKGSQMEDAILDSLGYPYMNDRYYEIGDAHRKTFEWIYKPTDPGTRLWSDFSHWLAHGEGIYWINGKAGSGKSTLMRYIYGDGRTTSLLNEWAGTPDGLLSAGFFFWKSGVPEQASQTGLLRSLLHTLLSQKRQLIPKVLPKDWKECQRLKSSCQSTYELRGWRPMELINLIKSLFNYLVGTRTCLFIDGLDEYNGSPTDNIQLLKDISSSNVKICVSSRPWNEFHQAFDGFPGLRLQDLTFDDISLYVNETLAADARMKSLSDEQPTEASKIVTEIVTKADGVFLWVKLVAKSLLEGIGNGDSIFELGIRLQELPSDLAELYAHMLNTVKERYRIEGWKYFQMMQAWGLLDILPAFRHANKHPIRALVLDLGLKDASKSWNDSTAPILTGSEMKRLVSGVDKRLKVCCAGLLELSGAGNFAAHDVAAEAGDWNPLVKYIHRTAADFLVEAQTSLPTNSSIDFGPNINLLRGYISQLRSHRVSTRVQIFEPEGRLGTILSLAYIVEKENAPLSVEYIDDMLTTLLRHLPVPHQKKKARLANPGFIENLWPREKLVLAVRASLFRYLTVKLGLPKQLPRSTCGRSYLYYALSAEEHDVDNHYGIPGETTEPLVSSERIIAFLLPHSSRTDIKESWERVLFYAARHVEEYERYVMRSTRDDIGKMLLAILQLFLEFGAHPSTKTRRQKRIMCGGDGFLFENYKEPNLVEQPEFPEWDVERILHFLAGDHPIEVGRVRSVIMKRQRRLPQFGFFKHTAHVKQSNVDWQQYPERTWWKGRGFEEMT